MHRWPTGKGVATQWLLPLLCAASMFGAMCVGASRGRREPLLLQQQCSSSPAHQPNGAAVPVVSLVVVSCNKHDHPQSYWDTMGGAVHRDVLGTTSEVQRLDALVWLGDVVYADTPVLPGYWVATPIEGIRAKYVAQASNAHYQRFLSSAVLPRGHVYGVWDDHDFGMNDGGKEYKDKDAVQQLFLDFLGVPLHLDGGGGGGDVVHPRRAQAGLYSFEAIPFPEGTGTPDHQGESAARFPSDLYDAAVCLILLDVRYFRDDFSADRSGDMLGEQQWQWLDGTLRDRVSDIAANHPPSNRTGATTQTNQAIKKTKKCAVTLIGSGIQFLLDEKPTEHWGNFPKSRNRLLNMLKQHSIHRVVFLSGDVHLGEVGLDASADALAVLGYPMVELTSSGLTHSASSIPFVAERFLDMFPTPRRVGEFLGKNFGSVSLMMAPCVDGAGGGTDGLISLRPAVRLRVHNLEKPAEHAPSSSGGPTERPSTVMVELIVPLDALEPSPRQGDPVVADDGIAAYPDTAPGAVKRILMATQRYVFPTAKFHQLINMYVYGFLLVLAVVVGLLARLAWMLARRWWRRAVVVPTRWPQKKRNKQQ